MVGFLVVLTLCGLAATVWVLRQQRRREDAILTQAFFLHQQRARASLPPEQLAALTRELEELQRLELQAMKNGVAAGAARRMTLQAAIRSMAAHMELNRVLPG